MTWRSVVAMVAVLPWVVLTAAPAEAETELSLSLDGVVWTDAITDPVFPTLTWVPGDVETADIFVRNTGGSIADLTVDVTPAGDPDLIDQLLITAQGAGGTWTAVSGPGSHQVLTAPGIANGGIETITLRVAFKSGASNLTQLKSASLSWLVTLTEGVPAVPEDSDGSGPAGMAHLPGTGSAASRWLLAVAATSIGAGCAVLATRRSSKEVTT